jgi:hypothetical protein
MRYYRPDRDVSEQGAVDMWRAASHKNKHYEHGVWDDEKDESEKQMELVIKRDAVHCIDTQRMPGDGHDLHIKRPFLL